MAKTLFETIEKTPECTTHLTMLIVHAAHQRETIKSVSFGGGIWKNPSILWMYSFDSVFVCFHFPVGLSSISLVLSASTTLCSILLRLCLKLILSSFSVQLVPCILQYDTSNRSSLTNLLLSRSHFFFCGAGSGLFPSATASCFFSSNSLATSALI